jgi:hypothetical protein
LVDRSTTSRHGMDLMDSFANGGPGQRSRAVSLDGCSYLAKVRVAGSSPVVRSGWAVSRHRKPEEPEDPEIGLFRFWGSSGISGFRGLPVSAASTRAAANLAPSA